MPTYYADSVNGNNANGGTSWADAKQTLNGVEDIPVAAGDTVYTRGVFRELLTCDVSGNVVYDGLGLSRITDSDNDYSGSGRNYCIFANNKTGRTFRGYRVDSAATVGIYAGTDWTIEFCRVLHCNIGIYLPATSTGSLINGCRSAWNKHGIQYAITGTTVEDNTNHTVRNSQIFSNSTAGVYNYGKGGLAINGCTVFGNYLAIYLVRNLNVGQTETVRNSIIVNNINGLYHAGSAPLPDFIDENFNTVRDNNVDRINVTAGANSNAYIPQFITERLIDGYVYSEIFSSLSEWSQLATIASSGAPADDLHDIARVANQGRGAIQYEATRRAWDDGEPRGRRGV